MKKRSSNWYLLTGILEIAFMVLVEPQVWDDFFLHNIFCIFLINKENGQNEQLLKIKILEILYFFQHSFSLHIL